MYTLVKDYQLVLQKQYTAFFVSASYEERSLTIANAICDGIPFKKKFVSISFPHKVFFEDKISVFEAKGFSKIQISNYNQLESATNFISAIHEVLDIDANASFLIDITTFTRQTLLIVIRLLRNILTSANTVDFVYSPALEYSIGLPENEKWLTKGIVEVNSVFGYAGIIRPSRPYHLVILMGYEVERAASLIDAYEPEKISIGICKKGASNNELHYQLNMDRVSELMLQYSGASSFEFSFNDITETKKDILSQVQKFIGHNTIISPMNNKLSTVASALVAFENEEIQLAIAIPALYNTENYSSPSDKFYHFTISELVKH